MSVSTLVTTLATREQIDAPHKTWGASAPSTRSWGSGSKCTAWLARHGVSVTVQRGHSQPRCLQRDPVASRRPRCGPLVIGLYGHSRLREWAEQDVLGHRRSTGGTESLAVQWVKIAAPSLGVMLAAVARPADAGPFPTIVLLHGSHGFAQEYVRLAQDLATGGDVVAVAACWFGGNAGNGARFITPSPVRMDLRCRRKAVRNPCRR